MGQAPVWRGHSTNLVGIPTGLFASPAFNNFLVSLHIAGLRGINRPLFTMLAAAVDRDEAAEAFKKYMYAVFGEGNTYRTSDERLRYRTSYHRLLKDRGFNANGPAGAVLKGWVESCFGPLPAYH